MRIAALYDDVLVESAPAKKLGMQLRDRFELCVQGILQVWSRNACGVMRRDVLVRMQLGCANMHDRGSSCWRTVVRGFVVLMTTNLQRVAFLSICLKARRPYSDLYKS